MCTHTLTGRCVFGRGLGRTKRAFCLPMVVRDVNPQAGVEMPLERRARSFDLARFCHPHSLWERLVPVYRSLPQLLCRCANDCMIVY